MGKVYITGYKGVATRDRQESLDVLTTPEIFFDSVEIDDQPQASKPFDQDGIVMIKVIGEDCCIAFGEDPSPDPDQNPWQDGERHEFQAVKGHRLGVIAAKVGL